MAAENAQPELPTGYYLDNFLTVGRWVNQWYADLLNPHEQAFWQTFNRCSLAAQRLYVRLALRRGPLFRSDKVHYAEIPAIDTAAAELCQAGLLSQVTALPARAWCQLLLKPELVSSFAASVDSLSRSDSKQRAIERITGQLGDEPLEQETLTGLDFHVWQVEYLDTLTLWRLLFFGNLRQDFSEFILLDLGRYRYETYAISREERLFDSRARIEGYLELFGYAEAYEQQPRDSEFVLALAELLLAKQYPDALQPRYCRLANRVARQLERQQETALAMQLYQRCTSLPPARERITRLLHQNGELEQAEQLLSEILAAPLDEEERAFCQRFAPKLRRARGEKVPRQRKPEPPSSHLTLQNRADCRVEQLTADALSADGWQVFYTENQLMCALFGLCFWQQIFEPQPRVFFNRYQRGPRDLFSPQFAQLRQTSLQRQLSKLAAMSSAARLDYLQQRWHEKQGIANYFVNWELPLALLLQACRIMPWSHIAAVLERMLFDPRQNRSGFPDLIAFKPDDPDDNGYCWFEVKGPGDSLQDNQRRWLSFFSEQGIPHQVVWVTWQS